MSNILMIKAFAAASEMGSPSFLSKYLLTE